MVKKRAAPTEMEGGGRVQGEEYKVEKREAPNVKALNSGKVHGYLCFVGKKRPPLVGSLSTTFDKTLVRRWNTSSSLFEETKIVYMFCGVQ